MLLPMNAGGATAPARDPREIRNEFEKKPPENDRDEEAEATAPLGERKAGAGAGVVASPNDPLLKRPNSEGR